MFYHFLQIISRIRQSGNTVAFTVVDEKSDCSMLQGKPFLFRIRKNHVGGYGFYLWYDENGHYVEDVTLNSPADKAGRFAKKSIVCKAKKSKPMRVTSGGLHRCGLEPGQHSSEETSQRWPAVGDTVSHLTDPVVEP